MALWSSRWSSERAEKARGAAAALSGRFDCKAVAERCHSAERLLGSSKAGDRPVWLFGVRGGPASELKRLLVLRLRSLGVSTAKQLPSGATLLSGCLARRRLETDPFGSLECEVVQRAS